MKIVLATSNPHKLREVQALFAGSELEIVGLDEWPDLPEAPEDEPSFAGNALQKARVVFEQIGLPTVADDSGIEIRALQWAPGVRSKRWTPEGTDDANNAKLLHELAEETDRVARYRCAIGLVTSAGERVAEGSCVGTIGSVPQGSGGFGYDPFFWPDAFPGRTMAEISLQEKNTISHRAEAFRDLPRLVRELLG
jgi:XTP/dITP diphosphohydrolase